MYEGMFLVDSLEAVDATGKVLQVLIKTILQRADAEIVTLKKWDDRKLMYPINKKTRGTYILCYFKAAGPRITEIEKDVQLSERIMRALILSAEPMSQADMDRETPLEVTEKLGRPVAQAVIAPEPEAIEENSCAGRNRSPGRYWTGGRRRPESKNWFAASADSEGVKRWRISTRYS